MPPNLVRATLQGAHIFYLNASYKKNVKTDSHNLLPVPLHASMVCR